MFALKEQKELVQELCMKIAKVHPEPHSFISVAKENCIKSNNQVLLDLLLEQIQYFSDMDDKDFESTFELFILVCSSIDEEKFGETSLRIYEKCKTFFKDNCERLNKTMQALLYVVPEGSKLKVFIDYIKSVEACGNVFQFVEHLEDVLEDIRDWNLEAENNIDVLITLLNMFKTSGYYSSAYLVSVTLFQSTEESKYLEEAVESFKKSSKWIDPSFLFEKKELIKDNQELTCVLEGDVEKLLKEGNQEAANKAKWFKLLKLGNGDTFKLNDLKTLLSVECVEDFLLKAAKENIVDVSINQIEETVVIHSLQHLELRWQNIKEDLSEFFENLESWKNMATQIKPQGFVEEEMQKIIAAN
ncbi:hypothetical protein ROZALSC1DRAFT_28031 [Rozella allomycis CSF55]|uniref:PCI domain-containing protein n=1 Tax=Rozella allomycis (strain CSF55) TaxID=988480 RepID=A0A4P9YLE7_ROZAC|nr:hypothetical protein ROZALSC1DRAFT_28031 [Rozella allomycis CSF55]